MSNWSDISCIENMIKHFLYNKLKIRLIFYQKSFDTKYLTYQWQIVGRLGKSAVCEGLA